MNKLIRRMILHSFDFVLLSIIISSYDLFILSIITPNAKKKA